MNGAKSCAAQSNSLYNETGKIGSVNSKSKRKHIVYKPKSIGMNFDLLLEGKE